MTSLTPDFFLPRKHRGAKKKDLPKPRDRHATALLSLAKKAREVERNVWASTTRINWSKFNAEDRAREFIGDHLCGYLRSISDSADKFDTTPERVFRNVAVWADDQSVRFLRFIAEWDAQQSSPKLLGLDKTVIKSLPTYDERLQALFELIRSKNEVSLTTIEQLIPRHPRVLLKAQFTRIGGDNRRHQTTFIRDILKAGYRLNWEDDRDGFFKCLRLLLREKRVPALLTSRGFSQLPKELQRKVLSGYSKVFAAGEKEKAAHRLKGLPKQEEGKALAKNQKSTPQWLQAQESIKSGDFSGDEVLRFFKDASKGRKAYSILCQSLRRAPQKYANPDQPFLDFLRKAKPRPAFLAAYLITGMFKGAFTSLKKANLRTVVELKYILDSERFVWLAEKFDVDAITEEQQRIPAVESLFLELVRHQLASPNQRVARRGLKNLTTGILQLGFTPKKVLDFAKLDKHGWLQLITSRPTIKKLLDQGTPEVKEAIIIGIRNYRRITDFDRKYPYVAADIAKTFPDIILKAAGTRLSSEELFGILNSQRALDALKILGPAHKCSQNPVWKKALRLWAADGQRIPKPILDQAVKDRALAEELITLAHGGIKSSYLKKLPLDLLVKTGIRYRKLAARIDKTIPRHRLAKLIPGAQKTWEKKPAVGAAIELALAFGLRYAGYLIYLSKRVRPPFDKAEKGHIFDDLYHTYKLPKKSGGTRKITAPDPRLKAFQRAILDEGISKLAVHPAATGFVIGKSIVENARPHVGQPVVVNVDVKGFFPSTRFSLILSAMKQIGPKSLSDRAHWLLAEICSYGGGLPIGAPTSPGLANLILKPVDTSLSKSANRLDVVYTRYADDITLSGDDPVHLLPFVRQVLSDYGYKLEDKKTNIFRKGRRQVVTGLVVNKKPNLAKGLRKIIRAAVHHRITGKQPTWHGQPMNDEELMGRISFLNQVQPQEAASLKAQLITAMEASNG